MGNYEERTKKTKEFIVRMWMVDPSKMCRKHLLGEHVEISMFSGSIRKGVSIEGYVRNNLLEVSSLKTRHDEIAVEMKNRSYNHRSAFTYEEQKTCLDKVSDGCKIYRIDREKSLYDLLTRCEECKQKLGENK